MPGFEILLYRVALVAAFAGIVWWVVDYSLTDKWWHNPVGRTLVIVECLVALLLVGPSLSLFFMLSRLDSAAVGWTDLGLIGIVGPAMVQRIWVFRRLRKYAKRCLNGHGLPFAAFFCPTCGVPVQATPPGGQPVAD